MELKDYKAIDEAIEKAEDDVTPFTVVTEDSVNVVGDANKTEVNRHDFSVTFRIPQRTKEGFKYQKITKEYKDVFITPRNDSKVVKLITALMPYFRKIRDGKQEKLTDEEAREIVDKFDDQIMDLMEQTVSSVLRIPSELAEYIMTDSLVAAATQIILDYPETVNEGNAFFSKSPSRGERKHTTKE